MYANTAILILQIIIEDDRVVTKRYENGNSPSKLNF